MPELTEMERNLLIDIAGTPGFDDANLHGERQEAATRLWRLKLISAMPVEGSDASVEALSVTTAGQNELGLWRDTT